jgi:hypothetical protein
VRKEDWKLVRPAGKKWHVFRPQQVGVAIGRRGRKRKEEWKMT